MLYSSGSTRRKAPSSMYVTIKSPRAPFHSHTAATHGYQQQSEYETDHVRPFCSPLVMIQDARPKHMKAKNTAER